MLIHSQLVATKFFVPVVSGTFIPRHRLTTLLQESLKHPLTLVSAPAGFGKTTLLSSWVQSLPPTEPLVAWVSLDEEDNDSRLFWTYVINALELRDSEKFGPLLKNLCVQQVPLFKSIITNLINLLTNSDHHFLLVLDDYHLITEKEVHSTLSYLLDHIPPRLHIILATRTDPPLPLAQLRARRRVLEIHTEQLRCTVEETNAFFKEMVGTEFANETVQEVRKRTDGWLAGLHLLALSLRHQVGLPTTIDPATLLGEISGDQRYILDFLIQEVLQRQSQEIQTFLLSTCILERFTVSLCDAVVQHGNSQQMLEQLEKANLFVISLDSKRQWYRYHHLFAEALRSHLERTQSDLALVLHRRASLWYTEHGQTTEAILHAFQAREWGWTADLIERKSLQLISLTWGAGQHTLTILQRWIEQLPTEVIHSRPTLCLACTQLLWTVASHAQLDTWLDAAEAVLMASLATQADEDVLYSTGSVEDLQKQGNLRHQYENQIGEVFAFRAVIRSHEEDAQAALPLCKQAFALLSTENLAARAFVSWAQQRALYVSAANNAVASIESGFHSSSLAQAAGQAALAIGAMGATAMYMVGAGQLHKAQRLTQQAMQLGTQPGGIVLPDVCWPLAWQGEILREWNKLDAALEFAEEAILLSPQTASIVSIVYSLLGYMILMRIALSRGELDRACSALQQAERVSMSMNQPLALHYNSLFTTVDQVRLWLACGELDRAVRWAKELDLGARHGTPLAREREEAAYARLLLATAQPALALKRLEPVLLRATVGQRWSHVIEIRILQALAYQICGYEGQVLTALSVAVRLAEPEGYIRLFVDEGPSMAALLSRLREQQREQGPTPYLDTLLAAFPQQSKRSKSHSKKSRRVTKESIPDE